MANSEKNGEFDGRPASNTQCLVSSYSDTPNSYRTRLLEGNLIVGQTTEDIHPLNTNSIATYRQHNSASKDGQHNSYIRSLISGGKANRVLTCLLCLNLFASILNTLLLTFVFKTIKLNDRGIQNGQVSWDEQVKSSALELATRLDGKSIWLQSIEAQPAAGIEQTFRLRKLAAVFRGDEDNRIVIAAAADNQPVSAPDDYDDAANYLAIGDQINSSGQRELEIGAKLFSWILLANSSSSSSSSLSVNSNQESDRSLVEFDAHRESITLNLERKLRLAEGDRSSSLNVDATLNVPELTGTLEENLRVLARDGEIKCQSGGQMLLTAKSASAKLTSSGELILSSPKLKLSAEELYIGKGLNYFDSEPELDESVNLNGKLMADLRAYNLVSIGGLLMASST